MEQSDIGALFAVPMRWGTMNLGVLDLYRKAPGPLRDMHLRDVMRAADLAALMILWVRTDPGDGERLDYSLHGRAKIHQATGIVLVELGSARRMPWPECGPMSSLSSGCWATSLRT